VTGNASLPFIVRRHGAFVTFNDRGVGRVHCAPPDRKICKKISLLLCQRLKIGNVASM
jgi:hypothetical protein